jgi:hypothetical protein
VNEATFTVSGWYMSNILPFVRDSDRHHFVQVGLIDDSIDVSITSSVNDSVFDGFAFDASGTRKDKSKLLKKHSLYINMTVYEIALVWMMLLPEWLEDDKKTNDQDINNNFRPAIACGHSDASR